MKIYFKKKYLTIVFCIILGLFFGSFLFPVKALDVKRNNEGPSISAVPHTFDLSAREGEEIREKIKIYNRGDAAIPLRARVAGFGAEEETGKMIEDGTNPIINWFEFEKQNFIIDPGKTEEIKFSVKIPADAQPQGYYAVIFLEMDVSTYIYNESKLQVIPGLGIPFMLKVGEEQTSDALSILEYSVSNENHLEKFEKALNFFTRLFIEEQNEIAVIKSSEPSFIVRLKNNSHYHSKISGKIKLSGLGWKLDSELEFPSVTILPGKTRQVLVESKSGENTQKNEKISAVFQTAMAATGDEKNNVKTGFGLMRAELNLQSEEGISKNENRWIFIFSWWMLFLFLAILFLAIILFLLARRIYKRRKERISLTKLENGKNQESAPPIIPEGYNYFSAKEKKSAGVLTNEKKDVPLNDMRSEKKTKKLSRTGGK